jgi:hypothetical protein
MFNTLTRKVKNAFTVVRFGLLILRWCGLRIFVSKTLHQLYGRAVFLVVAKQVDREQLPSDFKCTVSLASPNDMKELFSALRTESPEGRYQLLVRKWYHERGFGDCYIVRAVDTKEICGVRWLITQEHVKQLGWEDRFPLEEDEYISENAYTFENYRRNGSAVAASNIIKDIVNQLGFKRYKYYIDETNIPSLKWSKRYGDKASERILESHFLFRISRKILEQYNPPVPVEAPPDSEEHKTE